MQNPSLITFFTDKYYILQLSQILNLGVKYNSNNVY